jgi:hypothetical protein
VLHREYNPAGHEDEARADSQLLAEKLVAQGWPRSLTGLSQSKWDGVQLRERSSSLTIGVGKTCLPCNGSS